MKKCFDCGKEMKPFEGTDEEGVAYSAWKCEKCGQEILDIKQAKKYAKELQNAKQDTFSSWGKAIALRVPAGVARRLGIKPHQKARLIQEKNSFKVIPLGSSN